MQESYSSRAVSYTHLDVYKRQVYCLKDVGDDFMADGLWKLIAAAITAVSYKWKHNTLISILLGTVSYMLFLHFFG